MDRKALAGTGSEEETVDGPSATCRAIRDGIRHVPCQSSSFSSDFSDITMNDMPLSDRDLIEAAYLLLLGRETR